MRGWQRGVARFGIWLGLWLCASTLLAQENGELAGLTARTEAFFRNLDSKTRGPEEVFTAFLAEGRLRDRKEDIKKLVDNYTKLSTQYGATRLVEQISARPIGKDVMVLTYLAKTDTYPIAWYITFYRPPAAADKKNGW